MQHVVEAQEWGHSYVTTCTACVTIDRKNFAFKKIISWLVSTAKIVKTLILPAMINE